MNHTKAFAIKFLASLAILYIILGLFNGMSFGSVFLISLILGIAAYLIGDLLILPRSGNMTATLADFGLSLFLIWMLSEMLVAGEWFAEAFTASIGIALFEYMFHKYVSNNILNNTDTDTTTTRPTLQYQTEFAEEQNFDFNETIQTQNENKNSAPNQNGNQGNQ